ncbi:YceI family protein [Streptomyces sp. NPDC007903]|uniref:YceI family protein n=1 Tax=Streptomyces sp. NPDC007903 TaxID=3364786 RepID=UPI0036EDDC40
MADGTTRTTTSLTDITPGHWVLDPARSMIQLQHKTMWGLVTVKGSFTKVRGEGEVAPGGTASGTLVLDATSLDTGHTKRDAHLRSVDFFDTAEHPEIVFAAQAVQTEGSGSVEVLGDLTVLGVTRPLTFVAQADAASADAVTLSAELVIDRADFGMTWNKAGMLQGLTTITLDVRFSHA